MEFFRVDRKDIHFVFYDDFHKNSGDFGFGSYFIEYKKPEEHGSLIRRFNLDSNSEINVYKIDIDKILKNEDLDILHFEEPSREWFNYMVLKRISPEIYSDHDIVIGPKPNKLVYKKLTDFNPDLLHYDVNIGEITFDKPPLIQIVLKTEFLDYDFDIWDTDKTNIEEADIIGNNK